MPPLSGPVGVAPDMIVDDDFNVLVVVATGNRAVDILRPKTDDLERNRRSGGIRACCDFNREAGTARSRVRGVRRQFDILADVGRNDRRIGVAEVCLVRVFVDLHPTSRRGGNEVPGRGQIMGKRSLVGVIDRTDHTQDGERGGSLSDGDSGHGVSRHQDDGIASEFLVGTRRTIGLDSPPTCLRVAMSRTELSVLDKATRIVGSSHVFSLLFDSDFAVEAALEAGFLQIVFKRFLEPHSLFVGKLLEVPVALLRHLFW